MSTVLDRLRTEIDDRQLVREFVRLREAAGHWVTIKDEDGISTHVFIGTGGLVSKGPKHLIGANIAHLPPGPHHTTHHPEGHTPEGHNQHPDYHEHQDKVRKYGEHGPGHGYLVDNPLHEMDKDKHAGALKTALQRAREHHAKEGVKNGTASASDTIAHHAYRHAHALKKGKHISDEEHAAHVAEINEHHKNARIAEQKGEKGSTHLGMLAKKHNELANLTEKSKKGKQKEKKAGPPENKVEPPKTETKKVEPPKPEPKPEPPKPPPNFKKAGELHDKAHIALQNMKDLGVNPGMNYAAGVNFAYEKAKAAELAGDSDSMSHKMLQGLIDSINKDIKSHVDKQKEDAAKKHAFDSTIDTKVKQHEDLSWEHVQAGKKSIEDHEDETAAIKHHGEMAKKSGEGSVSHKVFNIKHKDAMDSLYSKGYGGPPKTAPPPSSGPPIKKHITDNKHYQDLVSNAKHDEGTGNTATLHEANSFNTEMHQKFYSSGDAKSQVADELGSRMNSRGVTQADLDSVADHLGVSSHYTSNTFSRVAAGFLDSWSDSSTDNKVNSLAMQVIASEVFGLKGLKVRPGHTNKWEGSEVQERVNDPAYKKTVTAMLQSMHDITQEEFKRRGITHMTLTRGMNFKDKATLARVKNGASDWDTSTDKIVLNPLNSFTTNIDTAISFADGTLGGGGGGGVGSVLTGHVPVEHILCGFHSGLGCMNEDEFVLMNAKNTFRHYVNRNDGLSQLRNDFNV